MRSRAVNNGQSRLDDKELNNDVEEAEIKSIFFFKKIRFCWRELQSKVDDCDALFRHLLLRRVFVVINPRQKSRDDERIDKGITQKR